MSTEGRSAPDAYGANTGRETCARCGHTAPTCERCGQDTPILGGTGSKGEKYCHTFSAQPSCYVWSNWSAAEAHFGLSRDSNEPTMEELVRREEDRRPPR